MNPKLLLGLALVALNLSAHARLVRPWSEAELQNASDLIVVAAPIETKDLDETNALGWAESQSFRPRFRGVETTFKVSDVLKGMPENDKIVLHHYRIETEWGSPPNGPDFISFTPHGSNQHLLYLVNDGPNRYAPVAGQIDARLSIKPPPTNLFGFPLLPPIADADPSIRHSVSVRVPTRLKVTRTRDALWVEIDPSLLEATNFMVGAKMITGIESRSSAYPVREPSWAGAVNPVRQSRRLSDALDFSLGKSVWHANSEGFPAPGKKYTIELELTVFETDMPPQHMWHPQGGKNYKILWQRNLKQAVE